jgi:hypothetical protein
VGGGSAPPDEAIGHPVGVRPPPQARIVAPEFPHELSWLGVAFLRMDRLLGQGAVLVEFFDSARINSLRTLPYLRAWHERYAARGLRVVGVHTPGYSFGTDPEYVARAVERLAVPYPVLLDPDYVMWRLYGNEGWPARYLFDHRGILRYQHYGEGDYLDAELAVQEILSEIADDGERMPAPMEPLRAEDAPGALLEPQTPEVVLPADRARLELVRDWIDGPDYIEAEDAGAAALLTYSGAGAFAVLSGGGLEPGLYETDGRIVAEDPGVRLHAVQFTPMAPAPRAPTPRPSAPGESPWEA